MKFYRIKFFVSLFFILLLLSFGYFYRQEAGSFLRQLLNQFEPCQKPITYAVANLDSRFGLTQAELLNALKQAEQIWESPINKELFEHSPTGDLKINLIYDYRQKATDALKKLGIVISNDQSTYNILKTKYDSLVALYNEKKTQLDSLIVIYETAQKVFEKKVNNSNSRGGASKEEYDILEKERVDLNNQIIIINQIQNSLNEIVDNINSTVAILNKLIVTLNLKVGTYNTIGSSTGKEYSEGTYVSDASGTTINIFQFNNKNQLLKVLVHEFGHAIGLDHLDNPKAIMYYLNEGMNKELTADDLAALKTLCKIK